MKLKELMEIMSCKDGKELFYKVENILGEFGVDIYNDDGTVKSLYDICCEVAKVLNKEL